MKTADLLGTALGNALRAKLRTFLTVIAIMIGAFTLTLTSGLGAGINKTVDNMVEGFGAPDELTVSKKSTGPGMAAPGAAPVEYDEKAEAGGAMYGMPLLTTEDLEEIRSTDHVTDVETVRMAEADHIVGPDGKKWQLPMMGGTYEIEKLDLAAGRAPAGDGDALEITVPESWVEPLGGAHAQDVVGEEVGVVAKDPLQQTEEVRAEVVGVTKALPSAVGANPVPSLALEQRLYDVQTKGLPEEQRDTYFQATAIVEGMPGNEAAVKSALAEKGYQAQTLEDQLGSIRGIIDAITWVLNGFALIALLAASFGIINTLLMAVQERTREIGLMKALGMTSGKVFGLFSLEAVVIGLLGSLLGVGVGVAAGLIANAALTAGPLKGVAGLVLFSVNPLSLLLIVALIVAIAFIAGTLPAARAARKDPIEALRHE